MLVLDNLFLQLHLGSVASRHRDSHKRQVIGELGEGFALVVDPEDGDVYFAPFKPLVCNLWNLVGSRE